MEGSVKKLGFGCMRLPLTDKDDQTSINISLTEKMFDLFMSKGFTYFDVAYPYHKETAEGVLKKVLTERYPRDSFTVTDKMPIWLVNQPSDLEKIFNIQLERTGLTYFDYYWMHAMNKDRFLKAEQMGAFEFLQKMKDEGKIHHIGISFHDQADVLDDILNKRPEIEVVQLQINYEDWNNLVVQAKLNYETAVKHHKLVAIMEPVKGGRLANPPQEALELMKKEEPDRSCASWAIRFAASLDNVLIVLSGMSDLEQVKDNLSYMENFKPLTPKEQGIIHKCQEIIIKNLGIPCTGCHYCYDGCPKHIDIPTYFSLYNYHRDSDSVNGKKVYQKAIIGHGKASECIKCGKCEAICPQKLLIRQLLIQVSKKFEE